MTLRSLIGLTLAAALFLPGAAYAQWNRRIDYGMGVRDLKFMCVPRNGAFDTVEVTMLPPAGPLAGSYQIRFTPKVGGQLLNSSFNGSHGEMSVRFPVKPGIYDVTITRGADVIVPNRPVIVIPQVTVPNVLTAGGTACAAPWPPGAPHERPLSLTVEPTGMGLASICENRNTGPVSLAQVSLANPYYPVGVYQFVFRNVVSGVEHQYVGTRIDPEHRIPLPPGAYEMRVYARPLGAGAVPVGDMHVYHPQVVIAPCIARNTAAPRRND